MANILIVDIETCPDYSRTHLFTPKIKEFAPIPLGLDDDAYNAAMDARQAEIETETSRILSTQAEYASLVGLNFCLDEGEIKSAWVGDLDANQDVITERTLLEAFWNLAQKVKHIIGYNILRFDLPVILTRSAMLGVEPWPGLAYWNLKPWDSLVIDLMKKRYANASYAEFKSLKELRRCLALPMPEEFRDVATMAGDSVEKLYLEFIAGDAEALVKLKLYGRCDIWTTRELGRLWSGYFFPHLIARREPQS